MRNDSEDKSRHTEETPDLPSFLMRTAYVTHNGLTSDGFSNLFNKQRFFLCAGKLLAVISIRFRSV